MKPSQLSNTAAFIAVKFYGLTRDEPYPSLFDDEVIRFYEQLVQNLPAPLRYYHRGLKSAALRRFFMFWEELLLPGDLMHIILRKWYLTQWVEELSNQGYEQMLVLGAGFDHLAAMNASKEMQCMELDTPKMIALKENFVKRYSYDRSNLLLREAFFPDDSLLQILQAETGIKPAKKTIIVAEGFFDYFSRAQCGEFLNDLDCYFSGSLTLLSTFFSLDELSGFRSFIYEKSIKLAGEELKLWLNQAGFSALLNEHNFCNRSLIPTSKMKQDILDPHNISYPILDGFYLLKTEREP